MTQLPYSFDLLWDFKTVKQLHDHLTGRQRCATSATDFELITLAQELDVPLPPALNIAPPLAVAIRRADGRVPETATHYWISATERASRGVTVLDIQFFRPSEVHECGWAKFETDSDDEYPQWQPGDHGFKPGWFTTHVVPRLLPLEGNK